VDSKQEEEEQEEGRPQRGREAREDGHAEAVLQHLVEGFRKQ